MDPRFGAAAKAAWVGMLVGSTGCASLAQMEAEARSVEPTSTEALIEETLAEEQKDGEEKAEGEGAEERVAAVPAEGDGLLGRGAMQTDVAFQAPPESSARKPAAPIPRRQPTLHSTQKKKKVFAAPEPRR